jgi:hypothetical protein
MTVDRVHVLATPGLDRHATYVALSRHRDSVDLHYGHNDFADEARLVRTLSRERAKDMASDYARAFGDRRGIHVDEPEQKPADRNPFAGLRLRAPHQPDIPHLLETGKPARKPPPLSVLAPAVERHARIVQEMRYSHFVGDPYSPEQRAEVLASRAALDAMQPHGANDLESALWSDLKLIGEAANGRTANAIRGMQLEGEMRENPDLRADIFVQRWQALDRQRRLLLRDHETTRAG